MQQMAEHEPGGTGADDADLSADLLHMVGATDLSRRNGGSGKKIAESRSEWGCGFNIRNMRCIQFEIAGATNRRGEQASLRGRSGGIVRARNDQSGCVDARSLLGEVGIANGFAARNITLRRRVENHRPNPGDHVGRLPNKSGREPTLDRARNNCGHAASPNRGDPSIPNVWIANVCGRVAEDEASETVRSIGAQPDSRLPAHGKTAEIRV